MLQCTVNKHKTNWHHMLFSALWDYRTVVKTATGFTPFHLVHGIEATLPIECEIPTLRTAIELLPDTAPMEQRLLNLESLDEDRRSSLQNNEAAKKRSKATFDRHVNLRSFREGTLSSPMISLTIPLAMANSNHSGMALISSNTASPKVHTSWPPPKASPSKNPSMGYTSRNFMLKSSHANLGHFFLV
jgi:hypothetical protein